MKTLKILTAATLASVFSLSAVAGDFSQYDYEDYVQSASWPTDTYSLDASTSSIADIDKMIEDNPTAAGAGTNDFSQLEYEDYVQSASWPTDSYRLKEGHTSIADIERMLDKSPTAAGASHVGGDVLMVDLLGEDIHRQ